MRKRYVKAKTPQEKRIPERKMNFGGSLKLFRRKRNARIPLAVKVMAGNVKGNGSLLTKLCR